MLRTVMSHRARACIGLTTLATAAFASQQCAAASSSSSLQALSPKEWREFPVSDIKTLSHDTKRFTIKLPTPQHETGLATASCLLVMGPGKDGKPAIRPYTPTTLNKELGHFDLVIKAYPEGVVSSYMHSLRPGDAVKVKVTPNMKKCIGMIAGGTGITPMYQCIRELLESPGDTTIITLLYGSRSPGDILLKAELDTLAAKYPRFKCIYKVDKGEAGWKGEVGYIGAADISKHMPAPSDDHMVFVCGPPPLMKSISGDKDPDKSQGPLSGALKDKGYKESMVYKF